MTTIRIRAAVIALVAVVTMACRAERPLVQLGQAQQLSADLLIQFTAAADAANKAVMAETDDGSAAFVHDADTATQSVQAGIVALQPVLRDLDYATESELLRVFANRFEEYRALDRQILSLAAENTNRKAQRLSFVPALREADAFRDAVDSLVPAAGDKAWRLKALAATAVAAVREIQALEAPHIAEAGDAAMSGMEARMTAAETAARTALRSLTPLPGAQSRPQLAAATSALDRFMSVHAEITALSRRNTNVRSLALSLNDKGKVTGACEESLRALRDALAKRGFTATR
jgi:hypothetical protein